MGKSQGAADTSVGEIAQINMPGVHPASGRHAECHLLTTGVWLYA